MFNIGFSELLLIGVIGILVVGPDKLPGLARTVLIYTRKIRRSIDNISADIERELELDELRRSIEQSKIQDDLDELNRNILQTEKELIEKNKIKELNQNDIKQKINKLFDAEQAREFSDTGIEPPPSTNEHLNNPPKDSTSS